MVTYRELVKGFASLNVDRNKPVVAHASLSSFGRVQGGAESVVGALLSSFEGVMMPTFTYKTGIIPEDGPPDNGIVYGSGKDTNRMAEFFHPKLPASRSMGVIAETLRRHPNASRSRHPGLSFAGVGVERALEVQTCDNPLAPIAHLMDEGGWVLLLGVDHTANTSIHYAEKLAGRKQFVRWALTARGIQECPGTPGCSDGFQALAPRLEDIARSVRIGEAEVQAIPLEGLIDQACRWVEEDPLALLCSNPACERCTAVRESVQE